MGKISVFVISQQCLFRAGIAHSLSGNWRFRVVGSTGVGTEVLSMVDEAPPDVAIVDLEGAGEHGMTLAGQLRQRSSNIGTILLVPSLSDEQLFLALKMQAAACLDKETSTAQLADTVERVARGEHPINEAMVARPRVAEKVLSQFQTMAWRSDGTEIAPHLTPREIKILDWIARGFLNKQIAVEFGISEQTIKNHVTSILRKMNANARTEAVVMAIRQGLISIE